MQPLSDKARSILDLMEPDRRYEPSDLRALAPGLGTDSLREVMQELWINRQVERVGYSGWRLDPSTAPFEEIDASRQPSGDGPLDSGVQQTKAVKPEDLFDHATFSSFFK